ncbi:uncharacterized protein LOC125376709 [Haliotis rufescens]|uniref:uncharacterized protein LOC125376709 n=1 Tax=Haliotis rufescens TaxID=6454 RepID=UPI00201F0CA3|nr:uncharacterized protein LOC125376709 [Haliotis rufescens]
MSAVGVGDDDDLGESDFESDISVDSLDSDSESDSQEEISDHETEEEAGAKPMVRGPWLPVLDTDSFDLGNSIDFAEECGPVNPPDYHAPPISYFDQQLRGGDGGVDLFDLLVRETNRYAEQYLQGRTLSPQSRARAWRPVDREEMRAFLGLLLAMGVVRKPTIASYWNEGDKNWLASTPSFGGIMPRNRFQVIMRFLHCNDNSVAVPRGQPDHDPLHKIRPVLDLVNGSNSHVRRQGPLLAVLFSDRKVFTILSTMGSPRMEDGLNSRGRSVTLPSVV